MKLAWLWEVVVLVENYLIFIAKHCVTIFCCALSGFPGKFSILLETSRYLNCEKVVVIPAGEVSETALWKGCGYSCWWSEWNSRLELIWVSLAWSNKGYHYPSPFLNEGRLQVYPQHLIRIPLQFASTHLYCWVERDSESKTCFVQGLVTLTLTHWPWPIDLDPLTLNLDLLTQSPAH